MRRIALLAAMVAGMACGGSSSNNTSTFNAALTHGNEPNTAGFNSPAPNATGSAAIQAVGTTVTYSLRATGLSSTPNNAHVHLTPAGAAPAQGPVLLGPLKLSNTGVAIAATSVTVDDVATSANIPAGAKDPDDATKALTLDRVVQLIRDGRTYFNIHTVNNPSGEIRGDLH